jgi:hypothetical protein
VGRGSGSTTGKRTRSTRKLEAFKLPEKSLDESDFFAAAVDRNDEDNQAEGHVKTKVCLRAHYFLWILIH